MWVRLGCGQLQVRQARVVSYRWAGPMLWKVNVLKSWLLVLAIGVVSLLPVLCIIPTLTWLLLLLSTLEDIV